MSRFALFLFILLLLALEILCVYLIMPFRGSQKSDSLSFAYWLNTNAYWLRALLIIAIAFLAARNFKRMRIAPKIIFFALAIVWSVVFYYTNFKFRADKMFLQPGKKEFATQTTNTVAADKLIVGVTINGESKAYPIQVIGYHHQVRDTVGNTPVMVTYCTVCRTGRVFSPMVNGQPEDFRLVGMDHFNAMFEDSRTESWWQQATGIAVAGKLKGTALTEIPSQQSSLSSWLQRYPHSLILQPDTNFNKRYKSLKDFDRGNTDDNLEKRDSASWQFKSWVVGVDVRGEARAYDWNMLVAKQFIEDSLSEIPLMVTLEADTATFHVLSRKLNDRTLSFSEYNGRRLTDLQTGSVWNYAGYCEDGELKGQQLGVLQSSQEFWHSWQTFHPQTTRFQ